MRCSCCDDPDYTTGPQRSKNRKVLNETDRRDHQKAPERLLGRIDERGRGAVRPALHDRPDLCRPAGAAPRNGAADRPSPSSADLKAVGQAINMTRTPEPEKLRPTPGLGEHTDEVLQRDSATATPRSPICAPAKWCNAAGRNRSHQEPIPYGLRSQQPGGYTPVPPQD